MTVSQAIRGLEDSASSDGEFFEDSSTPKRPRLIDLFAGVGGMTLGAYRAGFEVALAVDTDDEATAGHRKNFPGCRHLKQDIATLDGQTLLEAAGLKSGELDALIGGPPCQGFSVIGERRADDSRNSLFHSFFTLVRDCKPSCFVAENVVGILNGKYEELRDNSLAQVPNGYTLLEPMRLRASDYGVPTVRERVFFIGYRSDSLQSLTLDNFKPETIPTVTVADALEGLPSRIRRDWLTEDKSWREVSEMTDTPYGRSIVGNVPKGVGNLESLRRYAHDGLVSGCFGTRHSPEIQARYRALKPGEKDRISKSVRLKVDGFCPTLRAGTGKDKGRRQAVRPIHPTAPRVITPREAARLQGFPDWFRFAPHKWHAFRQIGNSVSPIVAEAVLTVLRTHLKVD